MTPVQRVHRGFHRLSILGLYPSLAGGLILWVLAVLNHVGKPMEPLVLDAELQHVSWVWPYHDAASATTGRAIYSDRAAEDDRRRRVGSYLAIQRAEANVSWQTFVGLALVLGGAGFFLFCKALAWIIAGFMRDE